MYLLVRLYVPFAKRSLVHAHLGNVEWDGVVEHIKATKVPLEPLHVVQADKNFFDMVRARGMFPSPSLSTMHQRLEDSAH